MMSNILSLLSTSKKGFIIWNALLQVIPQVGESSVCNNCKGILNTAIFSAYNLVASAFKNILFPRSVVAAGFEYEESG